MATFGRNSEIVAALLASGKSVVDAASQAKVGERTIHRWLDDPAFRAHVADLRGSIIATALGRLADGMSEAAEVLRELLHSESETIKLRAAAEILKAGSDLRRTVEQDQEIEELKGAIERIEAEQKPRKG